MMEHGGVYTTLMLLDIILRHKTQACFFILVLLQLFEFSLATDLTCSVTRLWSGDRIRFVNYGGMCNKQVNPCQRISNSKWIESHNGCICQCNESASTYREDYGSCVKNSINREGCTTLQFKGETASSPLRVFNNSSSVRLGTLRRETCAASVTHYITDENSSGWVEFHNTPAFFIRHEDTRKKTKHDHFLEWYNKTPDAELFGKIVKVNIRCKRTIQGDSNLREECIVFKVKGFVHYFQCLAELPSPDPTVTAATNTMIVLNKTRPSSGTTQRFLTDVITLTTEPITTPSKSSLNNGEQSYIGTKIALPIWLIAVIAVGAVIATLAITAIVWICCKMKQRSRKRQKKRSKMENPLYNNDDDTVITFTTSGVPSGVDEAGYARAGSPCRKGYAVLKPGPARCKSDYQRLLKPGEDVAGYLVPMEERATVVPSTPAETESPSTADTAIYSEADSPPPQDKVQNKDYDYAKPDDVCLTSSRPSLDKLEENDTNERETGYAQNREHSDSNETAPPSPFYAVVEVPNSGGLPADESTSSESELNVDSKPEYVEVLPEIVSDSGNPLVKENSVA